VRRGRVHASRSRRARVDRLAKLEQESSRKVPRESLFANESAQGLGSLNPGDIGQTPARDSPVPRQAAERIPRLEARHRIEPALRSG
jgi:hypothetical protein